MPRLLVQSGPNKGADYPVVPDMILGRKHTCSVAIDDALVSREHARIFQEGTIYYIEDLGSSNGTYLNEVKISKSALTSGDRIGIGDTIFVFLAESEQNLQGKTIGCFQIQEKLKETDVGTVYKAYRAVLDKTVALLTLNTELAEDQSFVKRFIDEARRAVMLRHPNVIGIFDIGTADGYHYICMEHISGKSLRELMKEEKLAFPEVIRITRECASALAFAQENGITHRNITPSNIILTKEKAVKVAGIGIAGLPERAASSCDVESLAYISPEEALGMDTGPPSDIYALGLCMYEMLTGVLPFSAQSAVELIKERVAKSVPSPQEANPDVPESLNEIVLKMCAREQRERYESMKSLIADLERASAATVPARVKVAARPTPAAVSRQAPSSRVVAGPRPVQKKAKEKRTSPVRSAVWFFLFLAFLIILFLASAFATRLILDITQK